jgi:deazaflavin-dependent oxidoreductase (nitroreductase family)
MSTTAAVFNAQVIREFRARGGRLGGVFEGTPLLLVHHARAESGATRVNPVGYLRDGGRYVIFASNGGAPRDPAWVGNLRAEPVTSIEVGSETIDVVAEQATARSASACSRWQPLASRSLPSTRATPIASSQ